MTMSQNSWLICVDTGGTFTDCLGRNSDGQWLRCKVLSSGALRGTISAVYQEEVEVSLAAPIHGSVLRGYTLRALTKKASTRVIEASGSLLKLAGDVLSFGLGDLVELSAGEEAPILGARLLTQTALVDALPKMEFKLATTRGTNALLERKGARVVFFVNEGFEDVFRIDDQRRPDLFAREIQPRAALTHNVVGLPLRRDANGRAIHEPEAWDRVRERVVSSLVDGCEAAGICLIHGNAYPEDEKRVADILSELGVPYVVSSAELSGMAKFLPRAQTTAVDAYLGPIMKRYLDRVEMPLQDASLSVMSSSGGLMPRCDYRAKDGLLSGPAGGVIGVAAVAKRAGLHQVIAFDMGGTSTDVSRVSGEPELRNEHRVGDARIQAPSLRIETVAAGGGSICSFRDGQYFVGPESAGAFPGPACYGAGGPLTVTDVNLLLGHLLPDAFQVPLDSKAAESVLEQVLDTCGASRDAVLNAFWALANEHMSEALRQISIKDGFDPGQFTLVAFGGAGGQHACALAESMDMDSVLVPADAGILSAYGLAQARREASALVQIDQSLEEFSIVSERVEQAMEALRAQAIDWIGTEPRVELDCRFRGQESTLSLPMPTTANELDTRFRTAYTSRFGYVDEHSVIEIAVARCRLVETIREPEEEIFERVQSVNDVSQVIEDPYTTLLVLPGWSVHRGSHGSWMLERETETAFRHSSTRMNGDLLTKTLLTQRFNSLVEEMGKQLERTAVSTNVKERLDFSCAFVSAQGELITNAPHIPVHLGALGVCVRRVVSELDLGEGDVAVTNHPGFGGSHLPDITLLMPVFYRGVRVGYLVNRAHHAEVGGCVPGSMSPFAKNLEEEGVVFFPQRIVEKGQSRLDAIESCLMSARYPSRRIAENLSDLRAQLAALMSGTKQLKAIIQDFGMDAVLARMEGILGESEQQMRDLLERHEGRHFHFTGHLDDGEPLAVDLRVAGRRLTVDFSGTASVRRDSLNANEAIVRSALLYVLRVWLNEPVALNEGLMRCVSIILPESFIAPKFTQNPAECPAVVGGNVEVSQRIVETLISALGFQAGGQGTMNNLIFGDATRSYYETICGGSGAGDGYDGASAVHVHMTNTAITDVEILEKRYPVILEKFSVRQNSGGRGTREGGSGIERRIRFLNPMTVSLLMQGRRSGGSGFDGGDGGAAGEQYWIDTSGDLRPLPGMISRYFAAGESILIRTPGGGGFGAP